MEQASTADARALKARSLSIMLEKQNKKHYQQATYNLNLLECLNSRGLHTLSLLDT